MHGRSKDVASVVPFQEKHHFFMWPMKPSFHVGNRVAVFSGGEGRATPITPHRRKQSTVHTLIPL